MRVIELKDKQNILNYFKDKTISDIKIEESEDGNEERVVISFKDYSTLNIHSQSKEGISYLYLF